MGGVATGDPLDHSDIAVVIGFAPSFAVALEEENGEGKRDTLVAIGQRVVAREVADQHGCLVKQLRVGVLPTEPANGASSAESANPSRGSRWITAVSVSRMTAAASTKSASPGRQPRLTSAPVDSAAETLESLAIPAHDLPHGLTRRLARGRQLHRAPRTANSTP